MFNRFIVLHTRFMYKKTTHVNSIMYWCYRRQSLKRSDDHWIYRFYDGYGMGFWKLKTLFREYRSRLPLSIVVCDYVVRTPTRNDAPWSISSVFNPSLRRVVRSREFRRRRVEEFDLFAGSWKRPFYVFSTFLAARRSANEITHRQRRFPRFSQNGISTNAPYVRLCTQIEKTYETF